MAGSPSSENSTLLDAAESSSFPSNPPAPLDWELLSMSTMSASTLGLPPQKPHESETIAEYNDQSFTEKAVSDASVEPFKEGWRPNLQASASEQETHGYILEKDKEHEEMKTLVGSPHEAPVGAEGSTVQEEGIPAISSKKKKIRVVWWKRQVFNWQPQSRKYSAVLSIALVAAVVGIAVIGHRLHRERNLNHQLRLEVSSKEESIRLGAMQYYLGNINLDSCWEHQPIPASFLTAFTYYFNGKKLNDMMYQVNRMKEAMTGRRRVGVTRNSFF